MKHVGTGLILSLAVAFSGPVLAQSAVQVASGVAPLTLAQHGGTIECRSDQRRRATCATPWRDAVMVRQISKTACVQGRNWGVHRGTIWVDDGCSGVFASTAGRRGAGPRPPVPAPWAPGPGWEKNISVRCDRAKYSYNMCQVDTGRGSRVYLQRQLSDTRCREGDNWGWNRAGIWVDKGCSGVFVVERRWR